MKSKSAKVLFPTEYKYFSAKQAQKISKACKNHNFLLPNEDGSLGCDSPLDILSNILENIFDVSRDGETKVEFSSRPNGTRMSLQFDGGITDWRMYVSVKHLAVIRKKLKELGFKTTFKAGTITKNGYLIVSW